MVKRYLWLKWLFYNQECMSFCIVIVFIIVGTCGTCSTFFCICMICGIFLYLYLCTVVFILRRRFWATLCIHRRKFPDVGAVIFRIFSLHSENFSQTGNSFALSKYTELTLFLFHGNIFQHCLTFARRWILNFVKRVASKYGEQKMNSVWNSEMNIQLNAAHKICILWDICGRFVEPMIC